MKLCKNCGFASEDESVAFCIQCGSAMDTNVTNNNTDTCTSGDYYQESMANAEATAPKKPKKNKFLLIGIPVIAVVLIAAIVVCSVFVFGKGPVIKIAEAAVNTVEAESFTLKVKADGETVECNAVLDFDKRDISLLVIGEDGDITGVYDGYMFRVYSYKEYDYYNGGYKTSWNYYKYDISDTIKMFFDEWEKSKDTFKRRDIDWDEIFKTLEELDINIDKEDVEEHINLEKTSDAIMSVFKLLNDEAWLEECMDYEKTKDDGVTYYSFDVDFGKMSDTVEELFSDCAESSYAEKAIDKVVEGLDMLEDEDNFVKAEFGIKGKYLSEIEIEVGEGSVSDKIKIEFSKVGLTKLDTDKMQEYLDKCEEK